MPLYRVTVPAASLSTPQRATLADAVTRIHCDVTGAPATFVHVFFFDVPDPGTAPRYRIHGSIRAGRTQAQKELLRVGMRDAVVRIAGIPAHDIAVTTIDVPARWVMEGGVFLPEPGEEEAWMAQHPHA